MKKKVICLRGFTGGKRGAFNSLKDKFEVIWFDYDTWLKESFEEISGKLERFIEKDVHWADGETGGIIGISAGGIAADYYLKFLKNGRIDQFFSICTPFKGTYLAEIPTKRKGLAELRPNNLFLRKLGEKKLEHVKEENYWSPFDRIVIPGTSAMGVNPKVCYFPIHYLMEFWPTVVNEARRFLEE